MADERETMPSTSDRRVENNVMRHQYKVLTEAEKHQMQAIKDEGLRFWQLVEELAPVVERHGVTWRAGARELSLAKTHIEEAVMWAVKYLTR